LLIWQEYGQVWLVESGLLAAHQMPISFHGHGTMLDKITMAKCMQLPLKTAKKP